MLYAVSLALGEHSSYGDIIQKWKKIFFYGIRENKLLR